jgi:hypothetical protein
LNRRNNLPSRRSILGELAVVVAFALSCASLASAQTQTRSHTRATADSDASAAPVKSLGNSAAPITMEVFSDYQCPSCGNFFESSLKFMITDYVAAGKVYFVHRDFPLPMHPYSHQAARWSNAAAKIGKFQEVDAALFDNQAAWSVDGNIEKFVVAALKPADFKRVQKTDGRVRVECRRGGKAGIAFRKRPNGTSMLARQIYRSGPGTRKSGASKSNAHFSHHLQGTKISGHARFCNLADSEVIPGFASRPIAEMQ